MNKTTSMADAKIKSLLKKIESIVVDEDILSSLEKDLVKGYLRDLYELVNAIPSSIQEQVGARNIEKEAPKTAEPSRPMKETAALPPILEKPTPKVELPEHTFVAPTPIMDETPVLPTKELPVTEVQQNGKYEHKEFMKQSETEVEDIPSTTQTFRQEIPEVMTQKEPVPKKYAVLFESGPTRELSDMLSRSPISDIQKAFSINDRLLLVADLFGGQQEKFKESVDILNAKYSFEEAKSYMTRYLIEQYNWLEEERSERAKDFIRVVERRYLQK